MSYLDFHNALINQNFSSTYHLAIALLNPTNNVAKRGGLVCCRTFYCDVSRLKLCCLEMYETKAHKLVFSFSLNFHI